MQNLSEKLEALKQQGCFRTIKNIKEKVSKYIVVDDKKMLNLSSNDYLNLSTDKNLVQEFVEKNLLKNEFLFSSASARLLTGNSRSYFELEEIFKKLYKKDGALIFNTGYQANQGIVSTLLDKSDCIFSDKLNHASIVSGLKLSPAEHFRYRHNDMEHLERILAEKRNSFRNALIVSESVFSMDGDIADIKKLVELKKKYNCLLMIDEAHAFGVFGDNLTGVCEKLNLLNEIDIITVTFGKSLASAGAICISSKEITDYLINKASSFIFSTAIPPVNIMWSKFLLEEKFDFMKEKSSKLNELFNFVHKIYPSISSSQIIPVILGEANLTRKKAQGLQDKGFYVLPINPPTVPTGTSRLRISLTSDITKEEIENFFKEL